MLYLCVQLPSSPNLLCTKEMLESLGVVIACAGWVSDVELDFAYIPHTRNEENKSFGVIPDLQLFKDTHKLIHLNVSVYDKVH